MYTTDSFKDSCLFYCSDSLLEGHGRLKSVGVVIFVFPGLFESFRRFCKIVY